MLTNAMEVSGIEGTFRHTCETVMSVLRESKESLMAVLSAFVYDPLINWRLLSTTSPKEAAKAKQPVQQRKDALSPSSGSSYDDTDNSSSFEPSPYGQMMSADTFSENSPPSYRHSYRLKSYLGLESVPADGEGVIPEELNKKAIDVINRVNNKLTGRDFGGEEVLDVRRQVQRLIDASTSHENLCQCYIGWCPFW
jgi:FKBP12-rapamycin complex-associated protein